MGWAGWVALTGIVLVVAVAARIGWVLRRRRRKTPRNDIYPLW